MEAENLNQDKILTYWVESSDSDFATMQHLFASQDYSWSLFIGHLVIEKLLKALYVKHVNKPAPFSHDLLRLASQCHLDLTEEQQNTLDMITTFNINARYDNYKRNFYQLCTFSFTMEWLEKIKALRTWLKEKL